MTFKINAVFSKYNQNKIQHPELMKKFQKQFWVGFTVYLICTFMFAYGIPQLMQVKQHNVSHFFIAMALLVACSPVLHRLFANDRILLLPRLDK